MNQTSLRFAAILLAAAFWGAKPRAAHTADQADAAPQGILPVGPDGQPLNLDLESGTLDGWRPEGEAFASQPVHGDTVAPRRGDMQSAHAGEYWIGTYEIAGDGPQGTLTSAVFNVTHPFASFLVAGGPHHETRVELVRADTGEAFYRASGRETEDLLPVVVDLSALVGTEIFIRVVDQHSGHWGHINFDDFKFHAEKPVFPSASPPSFAELYVHAGLSGEEAAAAMTVPEDFSVTLFAAEPDVRQPIALALDDRGRVWVAEAYSYPRRVENEEDARDRILIFEDRDGDGRFDERKVFAEGLNLVSGMEVGFGGVWVGAAPYLLFIPDRNRDDLPDGPPEILLDGWAYEDTHETLNAFLWGPDGWLYGCHGVFTHSRVGKPGTPDEERVPLNAGIWRYHPLRREFEVFAEGTSNPWGVDFNARGQAFCTACVIPHLYHIIQGARYQRQAGEHFNKFTFDDIKTIAEHRHWVGNQWRDDDRASSDSLGGGHAHAGAMLYLGGKWPEEFHDQLFMNNVHGNRVNVDNLRVNGSGYLGSFHPDFLLTNDRWSQMLNFRYGPDGDVYVIDWYDKQACHTNNLDDHDRGNGRIYKIVYRQPTPAAVDLQAETSEQLVERLLDRNEWYARHARRILQERGTDESLLVPLAKIAMRDVDETRRLRGLWGLHAQGQLNEPLARELLSDDSPYIRGWTIQLLLDAPARPPSSQWLAKLAKLARDDPSPVVRLYLASALQRLRQDDRWPILAGLVAHDDDAADHNLPLMYWYALEPLAPENPARAVDLAVKGRIPLLLSCTVRRIAALDNPEAFSPLVALLGSTDKPETQRLVLQGISEAFIGRRQAPMPDGWSEVYVKLLESPDMEIRSLSTALAVTFGDRTALAAMRELLADRSANAEQRAAALESLLGVKDRDLPPTLHALLDDDALRGAALRGLAAYDDETTPAAILAVYPGLTPEEKRDALGTLTSRVPFALALLDAVGAQAVPAADLSADLVRQLGNLGNEDIDRRISDVWGIVRASPEETARLIAETKALLESPAPRPPDVALGRAVFAKTCQQCHTLFEVGGKVGPELTGSNRANLDYLLSNMLDPSAVMAREYQPVVIVTDDGRVITGIVKRQDEQSLTVATATDLVTLPRDEIDEMEQSTKSMMPDDILKPLDEHQVRSLAAYLANPSQSPQLATAETALTLFNGQDLTGWRGDASSWSVENGEIIGRTSGLDHNEFLQSELLAGDFRLSLEVRLVDNAGNSGIQFRSEPLPGGEVRGYQADIGAGWWGKLYEEHGRGLLWDESGEQHVRLGEWNQYQIEADGSRVRTWINGQPCVDLDDVPGARRGIIALQLHSGGPTEVRFRNLKLELLGEKVVIGTTTASP